MFVFLFIFSVPLEHTPGGQRLFVSVLTIPVLCASAVKYLRIFVKQMNKG